MCQHDEAALPAHIEYANKLVYEKAQAHKTGYESKRKVTYFSDVGEMPYTTPQPLPSMGETVMANRIAELEAKIAELVVDTNEAT